MTTVKIKQASTYSLKAANSTLTLATGTNIDVTSVKKAGVYGNSSIDWSVTNLGSVTGSAAFVFMGDATLVNDAGAKITNPTAKYTAVYVAGTGNVTNSGSIVHSAAEGGSTSAIYLKGGGTIVNKASGAIVGDVSTEGDGTITNKGSITNSGEKFSDIALNGGGTVTNSGTLGMTGINSAHASGIYLGVGGGTATNSGTITGSAIYMDGINVHNGGSAINTGSIKLKSVQHVSGIELVNGGTVDNTGLISVTVTQGYASGVELLEGGTVTNSGSIIVSSPAHGSGVTLKNGGTLINKAGGSISAPGRAGVYVGGTTGVTITNAGTISGSDSIQFADTGTQAVQITNTLILQTGSDLIGKAVGSTNAYVTNDLLLEEDGTASNVFANFQNLTVNSSAAWTLSADDPFQTILVKGTLKVASAGALSGALTIDGGTAIFKSSYEGAITFEGGAGELELSTNYTNAISGLGVGDKIDFLQTTYAKTDKIAFSAADDLLSVENAAGHAIVSVKLDSSAYLASDFSLSMDAAGHILITDKQALP